MCEGGILNISKLAGLCTRSVLSHCHSVNNWIQERHIALCFGLSLVKSPMPFVGRNKRGTAGHSLYRGIQHAQVVDIGSVFTLHVSLNICNINSLNVKESHFNVH